MAFRKVNMLEIQEVLRRWLLGTPIKRIARELCIDPKTARKYIKVAQDSGIKQEDGVQCLTEASLQAVLARMEHPAKGSHKAGWAICQENKAFIQKHLGNRVKLTKVQKLLRRNGITVSYATLNRFAHSELNFGRRRLTIPVSPCGPGEELQVDTARVGRLEADERGRRRTFKAWIFTSVYSRHRFVYPCFQERTLDAIKAFEAAWEFFGGVFKVVIPDNTKALVIDPDHLKPRFNAQFLEYMQRRGFVLDAARIRRATDKGKVERAVQTVRDDCFAGEYIPNLEVAQRIADAWCRDEYGLRKHSTTQRRPLEAFNTDERSKLLPWDEVPYDIPIWAEPKVGRDQHATVAKAVYSLPAKYVGMRLQARADRTSVRFYADGLLVKTHPRMQPGDRSTHDCDFPAEKVAIAKRDCGTFISKAEQYGVHVGLFAKKLLDVPHPWTRVRQVQRLLSLCKKFGENRVDEACALADAVDMYDIKRLARMIELGSPKPEEIPENVIPLGKYLRPSSCFAMKKSQPVSIERS